LEYRNGYKDSDEDGDGGFEERWGGVREYKLSISGRL
jgi:hypothetical protein